MLPEDVIVSSAQELGQLPILCPGPLFFQENSVGAAPLWIQAFRQALSSGTIQRVLNCPKFQPSSLWRCLEEPGYSPTLPKKFCVLFITNWT